MGEVGNQYWKLRSKHGRDRIVKDPKTLLKAADEYFQWCIDNPVIEIDYRGKNLERVELPHPQVFQKGALARWCGLSEWRLIEDLRKLNNDFSQVVTHIEGIIRDQKFKYGMVGMFNSNIVARDLGLTDKVESTEKKIPMTEEDRKAQIKELEKLAKDRV